MNSLNPAARFRAWFDAHLESCSPGDPLPTDRELALVWHLSSRTIRRTMDQLKMRRKIIRIAGSGTFVAGTHSAPPAVPSVDPRTASQRVADLLAAAITEGELTSDKGLPGARELCTRYRVSQKTLSTALGELTQRGLVYKTGNRFLIGIPGRSAHSDHVSQVLLALPDHGFAQDIFGSDWLALAYRKGIGHVQSKSVRMTITTHNELAHHLRASATETAPPLRAILLWRAERSLVDKTLTLLSPAAQENAPLAGISLVIDCADARTLGPQSPHITVISRELLLKELGGTVARFAASLPYRKLVLIAENPLSPQIDSRPIQSLAILVKHLRARVAPAQTLIQTSIAPVAEPTSIETMAPRYSGATIMLDTTVQRFSDVTSLVDTFGADTLYLLAGDHLAESLLTALGERGIGVPEQAGVLSLENNPRYLHLTVSACAPDWDLAGLRIARAIMGDTALPRTSTGELAIPCVVVERSSTRRSKL